MTGAAPIHVMHVIKGLGRGGAEMLLEHGQRYADPDRFRLSYVYFLMHKGALADRLRQLGGEVTPLPASGSLGSALAVARLARLARRRGVDLIHAHLPLSGAVARLAGRRAGLPVVYTEHSQHERHHWLSRIVNRATWGMQRRVIAVSRAVERSIDHGRGAPIPITVIPNGVPVEALTRDATAARQFRDRIGIGPGIPLVGQIAVFRPEKRLDLWLEAAAEVRRRAPDCHFLLVGDGPERPALEAHARALSLTGVVHFAGLLDDVRPALSATDVLMISSRFEGLPLALLEAMASSTAIVACAVGGIEEAVEHERSGLLVESADAGSLADAVAGLLETPERRRALTSAARDRVAERFSAEARQRRLEDLYLEVLAG